MENPSNIQPDQVIVVEGDAGFVPKAEPSDSGKVLGVLNSDGDIGWTEGASSSDIFVAKYGVTTYSEIAAAIADGKDVVCMYVDSNNVTYTYTMKEHHADDQVVRFAWLKRKNNHTISSQCDSWYEILMQGTTWFNVAGPYPSNVQFHADSATMSYTMSQNDVLFSVKNPLPESTSADEDKVLTVNSSGTPEWADAQGGGGGTTVGSDLKTVLHASTPVAKYLYQTFSGGAYPGETCFITSDDISGTIAAIKVPKTRFYFQTSAPGLYPGTTVQIGLYKNGTLIAWMSSAKVKYDRGYYHLAFPEFWYIPNTPLAALGSGERYQLILSYNSAGSYANPVGGQAQFFPYSDTDRFIVPDCTFSGALKPSSANMPSVSLQIDSDKGIYEKEELDDYGSPSYKLSVNNAAQMYDWDNYQQPSDLSVDRLGIMVPLQDDYFNGSGYQKKFPFARDFQKYGGQNHGTQDTLFLFHSGSPQGGDVYVVHIEAPATSTASGDHVAFCYFTLCETVEDWETETHTQYYHNFVLPGIYRSNYGGKFMADGTITISGSHTHGIFSAQIYSGPDIVALESGVTITPSYGVDGWNFCVSKI